MIVLDASAWLGTLFPDELHHLTSLAWMDHTLVSGEDISVPSLFLAEIGGAIIRRIHDAQEATRNIGLVRTGAMFTIVNIDPLLDLIIDTPITASLRGADAVYVALARRLEVPLVTWDREIGRKAGHLIDVREPAPAAV